jgi:hypothetical protein
MFGFRLVTESEYARMEKQIADLIAVNAQQLDIIQSKQSEPVAEDKPEEMATKPHRRLVKELRTEAEAEFAKAFRASRKP